MLNESESTRCVRLVIEEEFHCFMGYTCMINIDSMLMGRKIKKTQGYLAPVVPEYHSTDFLHF
jgi:hypothetical protein